MKKLFLLALLICVCHISFSQTLNLTSVSTNAKYGFSAKKAIKVGSISNEYVYMAMLTGPNGEELTYIREGSCCMFKTKNGLFNNKGLLDVWVVTFPDGKEVKIYLNGYDPGKAEAPKGFGLRGTLAPKGN